MIVLCLLTLCGLLVMPQQCIAAAYDSLLLCSKVIVPSLFPFFVCSRLLILSGFVNIVSKKCSRFMKPVFNVNGSGAFAFCIGIISGYPVGAKVTASLYEQGNCSRTEAERLLAFCNNSGPLFVIGAVGTGIFGSSRIGLMLYIAHILSALSIGFLFRFYKYKDKATSSLSSSSAAAHNFGVAFQNSIYDSLKSVATVCGYIVFFSVVICLLKETGIVALLLTFLCSSLAIGFLEITNGIASDAPLPVVGFLLAWSGVSIIMQVYGIISCCKLSIRPFIVAKLLQGLFGALYTWILTRKIAAEVFHMNQAPVRNLTEAFGHTLIHIMTGLTIAILISFVSHLLSLRSR